MGATTHLFFCFFVFGLFYRPFHCPAYLVGGVTLGGLRLDNPWSLVSSLVPSCMN